MTPEELSQLRKLCEGPAPFGGWPADMLRLVDEVDRLQDLHAEANKLLEQTIEVLEERAATAEREWDNEGVRYQFRCSARGRQLACQEAANLLKPLLDNLKALKKEETE